MKPLLGDGLKYIDVPRSEPMAYKRRRILVREMNVRYVWQGVEKTITLDIGFLSDGASIPRPLWSIVGSPYAPELAAASWAHDWCCVHKYPVAEMSWLFFWILKDSYVNHARAVAMRKSVYAFKSVF